jgi:hypothetical protein
MEVSGQLHAPATLLLGEMPPPRYQLCRRLGGPQSRSESGGMEKIPTPDGTRTPVVQSVAQSLYWYLLQHPYNFNTEKIYPL